MTKRMLLAILLLIVFALPAGCQKQGGEPTQPTAPAPTILPTHTPEPSPTPTPDPVGEALAGMTVEQKAAQLLAAGMPGSSFSTMYFIYGCFVFQSAGGVRSRREFRCS